MKKECYLIRVKFFDGFFFEENERYFVSYVDQFVDFEYTPFPHEALKFHSRAAAASFAEGLKDLVLFTAEFEICHCFMEDSLS